VKPHSDIGIFIVSNPPFMGLSSLENTPNFQIADPAKKRMRALGHHPKGLYSQLKLPLTKQC
jgi:hypothetical protein